VAVKLIGIWSFPWLYSAISTLIWSWEGSNFVGFFTAAGCWSALSPAIALLSPGYFPEYFCIVLRPSRSHFSWCAAWLYVELGQRTETCLVEIS
jgi:hypothetical protein